MLVIKWKRIWRPSCFLYTAETSVQLQKKSVQFAESLVQSAKNILQSVFEKIIFDFDVPVVAQYRQFALSTAPTAVFALGS